MFLALQTGQIEPRQVLWGKRNAKSLVSLQPLNSGEGGLLLFEAFFEIDHWWFIFE